MCVNNVPKWLLFICYFKLLFSLLFFFLRFLLQPHFREYVPLCNRCESMANDSLANVYMVRNGMVYVLVTVNKLTVLFIHLFNFEWAVVQARR